MSERTRTSGKLRIVCEMNPSSASMAVVEAAISHCRERDAELVVVWVVDPITFRSQVPAASAVAGTWGLVGAHGLMLHRLREEGIVVGSSFGIGNASRVLEEERDRFGADEIFTAADVPVRRCPNCGSREDPRAVHLCLAAHHGGGPRPRRLGRMADRTRAASAPAAAPQRRGR